MAVTNGARRMLAAGMSSSRCIIVLLPAIVALKMSRGSTFAFSHAAAISELIVSITSACISALLPFRPPAVA